MTVALVLLGLGWSATTVAGSTLLTEASAEALRTRRQGLSDLTMSLVGAFGAILAGVVLAWIGYGGLALVVGVAVIATVALSPFGRSAGPPLEPAGAVRSADRWHGAIASAAGVSARAPPARGRRPPRR